MLIQVFLLVFIVQFSVASPTIKLEWNYHVRRDSTSSITPSTVVGIVVFVVLVFLWCRNCTSGSDTPARPSPRLRPRTPSPDPTSSSSSLSIDSMEGLSDFHKNLIKRVISAMDSQTHMSDDDIRSPPPAYIFGSPREFNDPRQIALVRFGGGSAQLPKSSDFPELQSIISQISKGDKPKFYEEMEAEMIKYFREQGVNCFALATTDEPRVEYRFDKPLALLKAWKSVMAEETYDGKQLMWAHIPRVQEITTTCLKKWTKDPVADKVTQKLVEAALDPNHIVYRMILDGLFTFVAKRAGRALTKTEQTSLIDQLNNALTSNRKVQDDIHKFAQSQFGAPISDWLVNDAIPQLLDAAPVLQGGSLSFFKLLWSKSSASSVLHSAVVTHLFHFLQFLHPALASAAVKAAPVVLDEFKNVIRGYGKEKAGDLGKFVADRIKDSLEGKFDSVLRGFISTVVDTVTSPESWQSIANAPGATDILRNLSGDLSSCFLKLQPSP